MLITHLKPTQLWGRKVYDGQGRLIGEVVAVGSRRGIVRKIVVRRIHVNRPIRLTPPADVRVDANIVSLPTRPSAGQPRLRLVR